MDSINQQRVSNLLGALDLMDFSIELMRQNISRALPDAPSSVIERELQRWLIDQPEVFIPHAYDKVS